MSSLQESTETDTVTAKDGTEQILVTDMEVPMQDQSRKRSSDATDEDREKAKKRRSSLCTHRRSMAGDVIPSNYLDSDSGNSQTTASSQESNLNEQLENSENESLPNPANDALNALVTQLKAQIKKLNSESDEWEDLLTELKTQHEESNLLAMNLTLPLANIPLEVREFARSEYIKHKPLDLTACRERVVNMVEQCVFDREFSFKDVRLLTDTITVLQERNKVMGREQKLLVEERMQREKKEGVSNSINSTDVLQQTTNSKEDVMNFIKSP